MGETLGAVVDLETVPRKYAGRRYDEMWISEAQERMVVSVPSENLDKMLRVFADEDVEATVPRGVRAGRKAAIKVSAALRQYLKHVDLHLVNDTAPAPSAG